ASIVIVVGCDSAPGRMTTSTEPSGVATDPPAGPITADADDELALRIANTMPCDDVVELYSVVPNTTPGVSWKRMPYGPKAVSVAKENSCSGMTVPPLLSSENTRPALCAPPSYWATRSRPSRVSIGGEKIWLPAEIG